MLSAFAGYLAMSRKKLVDVFVVYSMNNSIFYIKITLKSAE